MPIDYSQYPANWKSEIVPRILSRAGGKCENCNLPNGYVLMSVPIWVRDVGRYKIKRFWVTSESDFIRMAPLAAIEPKQVKVVLTIAHLDHDETNHNVTDDRLKALCQHCHLNYDAKEKQRRVLAKSDWAGDFVKSRQPTPEQEAALQAMTDDAQELGLYDLPGEK